MIPAGAATTTALPSTNKVLSSIERTITLQNLGLLYGGSSNMKDEDMPFNIVEESSLDTANVMVMPSTINPVRRRPDISEAAEDIPAVKNMKIIAMSIGKRPLHGTKLLVSIAMSLSRGDSIIRQPVMPHALHPNPIHMVSACFPQALHF